MNAIQDRCRPKHQVLVLKCYPRTRKGAVDVKPNSSELSYLLFYATSRRSKIQKIGSFLEKKTASDVWRVRIGNVQVTLQILAALIEKSPKDLPLIASCVLRVLSLVLESTDITMVESSIPTFNAFCSNHDASSLFADKEYVDQYEYVVRGYASLASADCFPNKGPTSKPLATRWRNAGLEAIKSVVSSDALSSLVGRQLQVIVPIVLENLWGDSDDFLEVLAHRVQMEEKVDSEKLTRRRMSVATVRTADTAGEPNPIALLGTAFDVDKLAEEDISVLALQCLKRIFVVPSRPQIHTATQALLAFVEQKVARGATVMSVDSRTGKDRGWAIQAYGLVARWASVQDRYMILFTTMDTMVRTQLKDETLHLHLVFAAMVESLLRSDVNLIGLSVMDVLLQLVQQMKKLVLLPTLSDDEGGNGGSSPSTAEKPRHAGPQRRELLDRIERCIGALATHVYYADQVSDMVSSMLHRLRPKRSSSSSSSPRLEQEEDATDNVDRSSHAEAYFAFNIAKISALRTVKTILLIANPASRSAENPSLSRNRVPIQVWDGTHWLLRDPDGEVRKAYVDALQTWLERETTRADFKVHDDASYQRLPPKANRDASTAAFTRRAASGCSNHDKAGRVSRSRFLQLLHIAIYDNALQHLDYEAEYVLLHVLLLKLVSRLGVNAVRYGLPMIYRLQEDIQDADAPVHKVRLGSLVHGYFWTLTEVFDFEGSVVGRAIMNEVVRRRSKQFWVDRVTIPPPPVDRVEAPGSTQPQTALPAEGIESESLLPFDDRLSLVDCIAVGYQEASISPAASPAASPGRTFSHPVMNSTMSSGTVAVTGAESDLPNSFRETMLVEWTREQAMLALQPGSKSDSLSGSKSGTTGTNRNRLTVNGNGLNGHPAANQMTPSPRGSHVNLRAAAAHAAGGNGNLTPGLGLRKSSVQSGISPSPSVSSRGYIASVDQLRQVLSGEATAPMPGTAAAEGDSDSIDSMVSYEYSPSEMSFNPENRPVTVDEARPAVVPQRTLSKGRSTGPLTSNPTDESMPIPEPQAGEASPPNAERGPPVPPLPKIRTTSTSRSREVSPLASPTRAIYSRGDRGLKSRGGERRLASRGGESMRISSMAESTSTGMDLQELLRGIDSRSGEATLGNLTRPPY
ncbi:related to Protein EFR3 [Cephalotrichum gorgonifer]|uniref:Related to Protein EFR3 n=1 Tax=Cephalotrichum gorgonifer TaxID=2041049 RepID=A0AAE8MUJ3_9PEZI|nr:related to Protein EFR3 [Cephalotrichum gorgonifer]